MEKLGFRYRRWERLHQLCQG